MRTEADWHDINIYIQRHNWYTDLINYLKCWQKRLTPTITIAELRTKRRMEGGRHKQFTYKQNPDILHPSQLAVLCELLDFVCYMTAVTGEVRVDMRLTLTSDQLVAVRAHECMMICACNYYHTIYVLYVHTPYIIWLPHANTHPLVKSLSTDTCLFGFIFGW